MTQHTQEELITARDDLNRGAKRFVRGESIYIDVHKLDEETVATLRTLLDNAINASSSPQYQLVASSSDLDAIKKELFIYTMEQPKTTDQIVDYLAPRIVREGMIVVPMEPTEEMESAGNDCADKLAVAVNGKKYIHDCDVAPEVFAAMIAAARGE